MTGTELRAWRELHDIPRRALAQAVGYIHPSAIGMIELNHRRVPQHVRDYVASYTPPPPLTGAELRAWRHAHGLRSIDVGQRFGVASNSVRMWELGYRRVPWHVRAMVHGCPMVPVDPPWAAFPRDVPPHIDQAAANRQAILATVLHAAGTIKELQIRLPRRLRAQTVRRHLWALQAAGDVVRMEPRPQLVIWRSTLAAQRRAAAAGPRAGVGA